MVFQATPSPEGDALTTFGSVRAIEPAMLSQAKA